MKKNSMTLWVSIFMIMALNLVLSAQQDRRPGPPPLEVTLDSNGDGNIDSNELSDAANLLVSLDADGDGQLSAAEYEKKRPDKKNGKEQRSDKPNRPPDPVLSALDADRDQVISKSEIQNASVALQALDKNSDGQLTPNEFKPPKPRDHEGKMSVNDRGSDRLNNSGPEIFQGRNDENKRQGKRGGRKDRPDKSGEAFTMEQSLSDQAQWTTIAFAGLGFLTGCFGADTFFPPGKVADFWGFQYLRDNDPSKMGHNTDFLTKAAFNVLFVLNDEQKAKLINLARSQVDKINQYALDRFVIIKAFRRALANDVPAGKALSEVQVRKVSAALYRLDGEMSLERAEVMGEIIRSLDTEQRKHLDAMTGKGMTSWPDVPEAIDKRDFNHDVHVAIMTYAADLFSWYSGSVEKDVYFCPERQGTYFGSFFLKGGPARGKRNYTINENLTADAGKEFVGLLNDSQAKQIVGLVDIQRPYLLGIVDCRRLVSQNLRNYISGQTVDKASVLALMEKYGDLDGAIVYNFARNFIAIDRSLTEAQRGQLEQLRSALNLPQPPAAFIYSAPVSSFSVPDTDFMFEQEK